MRWLATLVFGACSGANPAPARMAMTPCQLVEAQADVGACVGRTITLRGRVTRSKIPTILGVDVDASDALADRLAEATGVLETYVIEPPPAGAPVAAGRGPGTYRRLVAAGGAGLATARALEP
jgi:hypothetical protein